MELSASNLPPHYLLTRSSIKVRLENRTNAIGSSNRLGSAAATGVLFKTYPLIISLRLAMTRPSELPDIDVLCYILELLSLKDQLAFSSICQAARTAALISSFSSLRFKIQVGVGNKNKSTACNTLENTTPAFRNSIKCVSS